MTLPGADAASPPPARRALARIAPFTLEIVLIAQLAALHLLLAWRGVEFGPAMIAGSLTGTAPQVVVLVLAGFALRLVWLALSGRRGEAATWLRDRRWWLLTARYALAGALMSHLYTWLKVFVPVLHRRVFDAQLYDLDRLAGLGLQPNVFFLNLFSHRLALRAIDLGYSEVFMATLALSVAFFLSSRDEATRRAFVGGFVLLWSASVWLYAALPALGPCYAFPEEFLRFREELRGSAMLQAILFQNYQQVIRFALGQGEPMINPLFGVAAFPSLHVGHVAFVAIFARRLARPLGLPLALLTAFMFVGSIVTGWHYMIDSVAGLLLAWGAARLALRGAGPAAPAPPA